MDSRELDDPANPEESRSISSQSDQIAGFSVGSFLEENYPLFAILSIFGVFAIYVFDLSSGEKLSPAVRVGFVSSLFLFGLSAYIILEKRLASRFGGRMNLMSSIIYRGNRDSIELLLFIVPFLLLVFSVISVSTSYPASLSVILQVFGFLMSLIFTVQALGVEESFEPPEFTIENRVEATEWAISTAVVGGIVVGLGLAIINSVGNVEVLTFENQEIWPPVYLAIGGGVTYAGSVYLVPLLFRVVGVIFVPIQYGVAILNLIFKGLESIVKFLVELLFKILGRLITILMDCLQVFIGLLRYP